MRSTGGWSTSSGWATGGRWANKQAARQTTAMTTPPSGLATAGPAFGQQHTACCQRRHPVVNTAQAQHTVGHRSGASPGTTASPPPSHKHTSFAPCEVWAGHTGRGRNVAGDGCAHGHPADPGAPLGLPPLRPPLQPATAAVTSPPRTPFVRFRQNAATTFLADPNGQENPWGNLLTPWHWRCAL